MKVLVDVPDGWEPGYCEVCDIEGCRERRDLCLLSYAKKAVEEK